MCKLSFIAIFLHFQREYVDAACGLHHRCWHYEYAWCYDTSPAMSRLFDFVNKYGLKSLLLLPQSEKCHVSDDGKKQL